MNEYGHIQYVVHFRPVKYPYEPKGTPCGILSGKFPSHHFWSSRWARVNCPDCLKQRPRTRNKTAPPENMSVQ